MGWLLRFVGTLYEWQVYGTTDECWAHFPFHTAQTRRALSCDRWVGSRDGVRDFSSATPFWSPLFVIMLCWHALGVGMPLALIVREPTRRGDPVALHA